MVVETKPRTINTKMEGKSERIYYLDILRIMATLAVILLHVAAQNYRTVEVQSFDWNVFNFFDSIVRWSVPIFVMISGVLFLDTSKKINIKVLYKKYILRIY